MQEIVVIDGEIELENTLDGEVELEAITDLDPEIVLNTGGAVYPHYSGSYTVTPSESVQTLDTSDKVMDDDVTVNPIPSEYIIPTGTKTINQNGTHDVAQYESAVVNVQGGITPTGTKQINIASNGTVTEDVTNYASAKITTNVPASAVDTGTKSISSNGTHDVTGYASANVQVPNSYSVSDEGKVVSNGALVAQTSDTVTTNDTYDTTLINSLTVNVSGGSGDGLYKLASGTVTDSDVDWTQITALREGAFTGCTLLTSVGNPVVTNANSNIFKGCTGLTTAEVTVSITNPRYWASIFEGCTSLTQTKLHLTYNGDIYFAGNYLFRNCSSMTTLILDIPNGATVKFNFNNMFYGQTALRTLVIKKSTLVQLDGSVNANSFGGIYSNPALSTIYVPNSLISTYETATNWSTLKGMGVTFAKIEGSIYE